MEKLIEDLYNFADKIHWQPKWTDPGQTFTVQAEQDSVPQSITISLDGDHLRFTAPYADVNKIPESERAPLLEMLMRKNADSRAFAALNDDGLLYATVSIPIVDDEQENLHQFIEARARVSRYLAETAPDLLKVSI